MLTRVLVPSHSDDSFRRIPVDTYCRKFPWSRHTYYSELDKVHLRPPNPQRKAGFRWSSSSIRVRPVGSLPGEKRRSQQHENASSRLINRLLSRSCHAARSWEISTTSSTGRDISNHKRKGPCVVPSTVGRSELPGTWLCLLTPVLLVLLNESKCSRLLPWLPYLARSVPNRQNPYLISNIMSCQF